MIKHNNILHYRSARRRREREKRIEKLYEEISREELAWDLGDSGRWLG